MISETLQDARCAPRIGVRTPVVIYDIDDQGDVNRFRGWTDDLSTVGAKLITENALKGWQIYVRIMLPELKDQLILCEVIREEAAIIHSFRYSLREIRRSCYGVRFVDSATPEICEAVRAADELAFSSK
jgi:hypothetical protein